MPNYTPYSLLNINQNNSLGRVTMGSDVVVITPTHIFINNSWFFDIPTMANVGQRAFSLDNQYYAELLDNGQLILGKRIAE